VDGYERREVLSVVVVFFQDYMEDVHGKELKLGRTTVKVPGQRPRGSEPRQPTTATATPGNKATTNGSCKTSDTSTLAQSAYNIANKFIDCFDIH